jgi:hypothetical protein
LVFVEGGIVVKKSKVVGAAAVAAVLLLMPVGMANATAPSPPAPTASEFAAIPVATTLHVGQKIPSEPNQLGWQRELEALAARGHATAIVIDAVTGRILWVTDLDNATVDLH